MIIAFGHRKRQGKDTVCKFINEHSGIKIVSFAGKVYEICGALNPYFINKYYYDRNPEEKEIPMADGQTPREFLIKVGQAMKTIDPLIWVKNIPTDGDIIISDLRFKDEAEYIKSIGGYCVKVERMDVSSDAADDDLIGWEGWDGYIPNSGTLEELKLMSIDCYERLRNEK